MVPCVVDPLLFRSTILDGRYSAVELGPVAAPAEVHWRAVCADDPHFEHTCLWRQRVPKRHLPSFQCEHAFSTSCVVVCVVPNDDAAGFDVEFHIPGACMEPDTPGVELTGRPNAPNDDPGAPPVCPGNPPVGDACTPPNGAEVAAGPNDPDPPKGLAFTVAPNAGAPPNAICLAG